MYYGKNINNETDCQNKLPMKLRLRFSLRTVFIVVTLIALTLGLYIIPGVQREHTIKLLENSNCQIIYEFQESNPSAFPLEPPGPRWVRRILGEHFFTRPVSINCGAYHNATTTADSIDLISRFPNLKGVMLNAGRVSLADFEKLKALKHLQRLTVEFLTLADGNDKLPTGYQYTAVVDQAVAVLEHQRDLTNLTIASWPISDNALSTISKFTNLEWLFLQDTMITDRGLAQLKELTHLKNLGLIRTNVTGEGLRHLSGLKNLAWLNLRETNLDNTGIENVTLFPALTDLCISSTAVTDKGMGTIGKVVRLEKLALENLPITDLALAEIAKCKSLRSLTLDGTKITDAGLAALANLPVLYELSIRNTAVTDEGLKYLDEIPTLMVLEAASTKITAAGVAAAKANSTDRIVNISQ